MTLELESLDRVYLNVYQPKLQTPRAVFYFLREHYGEGAVSSHQMKAITEQFLQNIDDYALEHQIEVITFAKGQRKEHLAAKYLATFPGTEGVLFIGKARRRSAPSAPRGGAMSVAKRIPGSSIPRRWSINITSTPSTRTSGRSS